jgi:spermidine synthase
MSDIDGFNRIARYYDTLKGIVFGKAIYASQLQHLQALPARGNILIIGGGSGELLNPLLAIRPEAVIWYVEASSAMISIAREKVPLPLHSSIHFIHGTEHALPVDVAFHAIITPFFLDLFPDNQLHEICRLLSERLTEDGVWIGVDFVDGGRWWQRVLLKGMYGFFAAVCGIRARSLPAWEKHLRSAGLSQVTFAHFYSGFIKSAVYAKNDG